MTPRSTLRGISLAVATGAVLAALATLQGVPSFPATIAGVLSLVAGLLAIVAARAPEPRQGIQGTRPGERRSLPADGIVGSLLFVDLDRFAALNELIGRAVGDALLAAVEDMLDSLTRGGDSVVRLGGDEFGVLLREADASSALETAERIRRLIGDTRINHGSEPLSMSVSIGIATIAAGGGMDDVINRATAACYRAKRHGRNRVEVAKSGPEEELRSSDARWITRVKDAMRDGTLRLYYQPIIDLTDGSVAHHEVLVRIESPEGIVGAGAFIPAAERCGLILELDRYVLRHALPAVAAAGPGVSCAVNLSALSLHDESLPAFLESELARSGAEPSRVTLELTESSAIADFPQMKQTLETLKGMGFVLSLDDFGVGQSSLSQIRSLPIDELKIDGSFVRGLPQDEPGQALVRSINDLAHAVGLHTVAEWVEDAETLAIVTELGSDRAQGFAVGIPRGFLTAGTA
ncbi:MAG TPA: bifunctional diguanylate cyclase/phosphodiesterase [Actinomycetota bacterium]